MKVEDQQSDCMVEEEAHQLVPLSLQFVNRCTCAGVSRRDEVMGSS